MAETIETTVTWSNNQGKPTQAFWKLWRADKDDVKKHGFFVSKAPDGTWLVTRRRPEIAANDTSGLLSHQIGHVQKRNSNAWVCSTTVT